MGKHVLLSWPHEGLPKHQNTEKQHRKNEQLHKHIQNWSQTGPNGPKSAAHMGGGHSSPSFQLMGGILRTPQAYDDDDDGDDETT